MTTVSASQDDHPILKSLNPAQRRAVTSTASTVAILAGPGSGKTHTLTSRVVWLIQHAGYQPSDVIVATFTVRAAREMRERIGKILGTQSERKIVLGTFHSVARRYLAAYGKLIGLNPKFGIADDGDSRAIVRRICKQQDLKVDPAHARSWISKKKARGDVAEKKTGKQQQQQQPENRELLVCLGEYQDHLARANLLDYDDLLVRCVELLRLHPRCVSNVQAVLIDEYQDTNSIQYELMKLFAQARQRITIVGDPDQSIYGWRSAEIRNLYRLLRDFPDTDEISLEENYRSSQSILDVALNVIQQDKRRYQKVLLPVHAKGTQPVLRRLKHATSEGFWVVSEIKRAVAMSGTMLTFDDVAVLLRSASLSRHLESALGKEGIAYRMVGGHKFYERKEIKVLLDYLRVVHQPDNNDALARIINVPRRGIGDTTVQRLLEEADQHKISLWSLLRKHCSGHRKAATKILPKMEQKLNAKLLRLILSVQQQIDRTASEDGLVRVIETVISRLDFQKYLEAEYPEDHDQRWANVQEFIGLTKDFVRDAQGLEDEELPGVEGLEQVKNDSVLGTFLANVALAADSQKGDQTGAAKPMVTISTIHAAKGLEWPVVFVPSVYAGSIPHSRAEDMDEERRLLYVAMTRAQALLYLSCPLTGSQGEGRVSVSPFVAPFAQALAKQGPTFDTPDLTAVAKILARPVPDQKAIMKDLPPSFRTEDNHYALEPELELDPTVDAENLARAAKRARFLQDINSSSAAEEPAWRREYATTMEQRSSFTIASLPGFTTAGAHQSALAAAAERAPKQQHRGTASRRKPDQRSLLNFVTAESAGNPTTTAAAAAAKQEGAFSSVARYQAAAARSAARAIDPRLAQHKISTGKTLGRPAAASKAREEEHPPKQYSCFSSSPTKPDEEVSQGSAHGAQQPAASLHTTTFMAVVA
ncbi:ATP-dependent DNA helicase srs2 [Escovopsis weberi]|uniref:DNA 3'-5' helicase n=1 Tax=Escovopsis weberi TaxID=150374 RepID=A0A0M8MS93_ESCWE|nr:ATP-dependent DNA helicase srs2 [Escovopsis weberi]